MNRTIGLRHLTGLFIHVLLVWMVLGFSIYLLTQFGSEFGESPQGQLRDAPWTPPGEFIGGVWAVLYTLMAVSLWVLNCRRGEFLLTKKLCVIALIIFCLIWPFYAFDTDSRWPGLLGNMGIFFITAFSVFYIWPVSRVSAGLLVPVVIWITIASLTILDGARLYGW